MDSTLNEIATHALAACKAIAEQNCTDATRLNLIFAASGVFVGLQRSIYRAHDKLYKLETATERADSTR